MRSGPGQWLAEAVATFGLLLTIFGCVARRAGRGRLRGRPLHHRRLLVHGLDLVRQSGRDDGALAVRHVRGIAGQRPAFLVAQIIGAIPAVAVSAWLWRSAARR